MDRRFGRLRRLLLSKVPGLTVKEMRLSDLCCGSAGIYNVLHTDMSMALLEKKMATINATGADRVATANPGCMLQIRAGVAMHGKGQRVSHVVEILTTRRTGPRGRTPKEFLAKNAKIAVKSNKQTHYGCRIVTRWGRHHEPTPPGWEILRDKLLFVIQFWRAATCYIAVRRSRTNLNLLYISKRRASLPLSCSPRFDGSS